MKTFTSNYQAELNKNVTTLAGCLKIVRVDNTTYLYTNHDKDIIVNTGNAYDGTYIATNSFTPTTFTFTSDLAVDNFDITNIIDNIEISELDLINDLFLNAKVWYFSVNYNTSTGEVTGTDGIDKIFYGFIGQINFTENKYTAEIRSLSTKLTKNIGDVFSKVCRTTLGSSKCGVILDQSVWQADTAYAIGDKVKATTYDGRWYRCTTAGTSDATTEPTWDTTIGNVTNDLAPLIWTCEDALTKETQVGGFTGYNYFKYFRLHNLTSTAAGVLIKELEIYDSTFQNDITDTPGIIATSIGGGTPANAIDNNTNTSFQVSGSVSSLILEFPTEIVGTFYRFYTGGSAGNVPHSWIAQVSLNGIDWIDVDTHINDTQAINSWTEWFIPSVGISGSYNINNRITVPFITSGYYSSAYFDNGLLTWTSGLNNGFKHEIKKSDNNILELFLPTIYDIYFEDTFTLTVGCNRHFLGSDGTISTGDCITKYNNGINFRGEPYIPSDDILIGGNGPIDRDE